MRPPGRMEVQPGHAQLATGRVELPVQGVEKPSVLMTNDGSKTLPEATAMDALNMPLNNEKRHRAANQFPSRQIANAMADVPDVSWRSSLDRCTAHPSGAYVPVSMAMYYRDKYNIPISEDLDLTGPHALCRNPLSTVLARSSADTNSRVQPK